MNRTVRIHRTDAEVMTNLEPIRFDAAPMPRRRQMKVDADWTTGLPVLHGTAR